MHDKVETQKAALREIFGRMVTIDTLYEIMEFVSYESATLAADETHKQLAHGVCYDL